MKNSKKNPNHSIAGGVSVANDKQMNKQAAEKHIPA